MHFNRHADLFQRDAHGSADVVQAVNRRDREVAALDGRTVAEVTAFEFVASGPGGFFGEDLAVRTRHVDFPLDAVEDEELGFRTEVGGVANAAALEVGLGALGDRARVAVVALAVGRLDDVTGQDQGGLVHERVDEGRVGVRHQQHVGGLDALPAGNRRAVECMTFGELVFGEGRDRHADVLLLAAGVGETEVDEADFVLLDQGHDIGDRHTGLLKNSGVY